ncbi:MAG: fibronectin type III domain-containing protein [Vicinamibacterales bacterium]
MSSGWSMPTPPARIWNPGPAVAPPWPTPPTTRPPWPGTTAARSTSWCYTAAARTAAGSDLAVQTRIALGVSETNTAYANSGIAPRLRLVGAEFTSYTEAGDLGVDLGRFQNTSDGFLDEAHTRRNALGADLVVLVVGSTAGGACGVGYVMTSLSNGFAAWAFSVTAYSCISPNYTFAHELGHNMGSAHAPEDGAGQASLYAYSFGYKHPTNAFRTVMAYNCPVNCPRVLHFSNPSVNYSGSPTGTVSQHYNALSIANAASTIANWRQAVSSGTPPTISAIADRTISEDTVTPAIAFTVNDAETAPGSLTVTASSSNTTLVPNTLGALALGGSGGSRTLTVTPTANRAGVSTISVTVSDGAQTATETFLLTVTAVNDAPTIARSPGAATIASGLSTQTTVTVSDIDTAGSALSLTAVSSNTTVLPNAAVGVAISGTTSTSRTFVVTMTPAIGQAGQSTVTLTGSDGAASAPTTFVLTVTIPVPPTISPVAAQTTPEDVPLVVPFTVADTDTPLGDLTIQAVSSNSGVVPPSGLLVGGTGNARTLTITPAANQNGASTITLSVSDGLATVHTDFGLTVSAVDDPPLFAAGVPLNVSTVSSAPTSFPVTVTDVDTPGASLVLNGASSNHAVLAPGGLAIVPVSSTATSRTFDVSVTPVSGATGTATITLQAADGTSTLSRGVQLAVTATPSAPDAPTALSASLSGTTLSLTWTPATTGSTPDSFEVRIGNAPGATTLPVQTTSASAIEVPLTASGTYYARVYAVNAYGTGLPSPEVSITTGPLNLRPGAPQGLNASFSGRTLTLSWLAPTTGNPATSYTLEAGSAPGVADIVVVPVGSATTFTAPGVPDGVFWVRIRGVNAAGVGAPSSDVALVMTSGSGCVGLPLAPVLRPAVVTGSTVALRWDPPAGSVTPAGYVLLAGTAPGLANIGAIDLGSTATAFDAIAPPGTYFLRVAARSACGIGAPSNEITMSVGGAGVLPSAPTGLTSAVAGRTVSLSWTAPGSGASPTSYSVEVGSWSGGMNLAVLDTGGTATALSGPVAPGTYYIRVRTRAGALLSSASNEVVVVVP